MIGFWRATVLPLLRLLGGDDLRFIFGTPLNSFASRATLATVEIGDTIGECGQCFVGRIHIPK
jgi:hypothetical protein